MSKKTINQNTSHEIELINLIESGIVFSNKPIDRIKKGQNISDDKLHKKNDLEFLIKEISSIQNCNSSNIILGEGNINSPLMFVGEAPSSNKNSTNNSTLNEEVDTLFKKMLNAINIKKENIYLTYAINFKLEDNYKPNTSEIKKYSIFLQKHISIIKPKIIILMGSTSMESLTGIKTNVSQERGKWIDIIVKNTSYPVIITFNPSYLLRYPEYKKYSWSDLKNIKKKIDNLKLSI